MKRTEIRTVTVVIIGPGAERLKHRAFVLREDNGLLRSAFSFSAVCARPRLLVRMVWTRSFRACSRARRVARLNPGSGSNYARSSISKTIFMKVLPPSGCAFRPFEQIALATNSYYSCKRLLRRSHPTINGVTPNICDGHDNSCGGSPAMQDGKTGRFAYVENAALHFNGNKTLAPPCPTTTDCGLCPFQRRAISSEIISGFCLIALPWVWIA